MLTTITAIVQCYWALIFAPSSAIWLIGSFIHKPTLSDLLNRSQFLVSQISVLFRASSPLENSIFSPRETVSPSSAILGDVPACWHVEEVGCPRCSLFPGVAAGTVQVVKCFLHLLYSRFFHPSRYTGVFCTQVQFVSLFFLVWTQREPNKTHFV